MYLADTLRLNCNPFNVRILSRNMQFLQEEALLFIISTTAVLSQKMTILQLADSCSHVKRPAVNTNNSKYSILGHFSSMNPSSQCPKNHLVPKIQPYPKCLEALASEQNEISSEVANISMSSLVWCSSYHSSKTPTKSDSQI